MTKKRRPKIPASFWDDLPEKTEYPYPEFEDEMYEGLKDDGVKPENLREPYRSEFKAWLEKNQSPDET